MAPAVYDEIRLDEKTSSDFVILPSRRCLRDWQILLPNMEHLYKCFLYFARKTVISDGASANRSMYGMHLNITREEDVIINVDVVYS